MLFILRLLTLQRSQTKGGMFYVGECTNSGLFLYIGLLARRVESSGVGVGVTSGRTVSPDWHQHMRAFTPLPLAPAWPCLGWPQQPLGKLVQPNPAEKEVVSFRGFALGQLPLVRQLYLNL